MSEIASLIRQFPEGSFFIILAVIGGVTSVARAFINRNKPSCNCDCCGLDDDEEEDEE